MGIFKNMKIRSKILCGYLVGILILWVISFVTINNISLIEKNIKESKQNNNLMNRAEIEVKNGQISFKIQVQEWKNILIRGNNQENFDKHLKAFTQEENNTENNLLNAKELFVKLNLKEKILNIEGLIGEHKKLGENYRTALKEYDVKNISSFQTVDKLVKGMDRETNEKMNRMALDIAKSSMEANEKFDLQLNKLTKEIKIQISILAIMSTFAMCILAVIIGKMISKPIKEIHQTSFDLSEGEGDLTIRLNVNSKDEIGSASTHFNKFLDKLTGIVVEINEYSSSVASGSEQLSSTMEQIRYSIDDLGNSSTTTAAAIEEMASTTMTVSQNVEVLLKSSESTLNLARNGGHAVKKTINEINKIREVVKTGTINVKELGLKTNEIGEIVTVINDIAAQTNLLALNAAIEAARAGDAGKGFEVVAEEVRKLAEKTTQSTKEISRMVKEIQNETNGVIMKMGEVNTEVEEGVKTANHTGKTLEEIVYQTENLKEMVNMIASSTKEQSVAADEIARQTESVNNNVEENGRAVEQSVEAIREIADIADKLNLIVKQFKINNI